MKKVVIGFIAVLVLTSLVVAACWSDTPETSTSSSIASPETSTPTTTSATGPAKTLKIGLLEAQTGWWAAALDTNCTRLLETYVDWYNEQGGLTVSGATYTIELAKADIKSTFDGTAAAANKLISEDGVKFIVGPTGFFTPAASAITNPAQVVLFPGWITNSRG